MKKLALLVVAVMITSLTFAQKMQEKEVPAPVKNAFQKQYPTASDVKWDKEGEKFEASFDLNKTDNSVLFDAQGNIFETEVEIELNQLPKGVLEYVKANYKGQKVKEAAKITDAQGKVTYEAEIKGMDLLFDANGKFIKEVKE
jgi:hypothetical protein